MKHYTVAEAKNMECRAGGQAHNFSTSTKIFFVWPKCDPTACMHFVQTMDLDQRMTGYCGLNK